MREGKNPEKTTIVVGNQGSNLVTDIEKTRAPLQLHCDTGGGTILTKRENTFLNFIFFWGPTCDERGTKG
jgi:hypothetical protein